MNDFLRALNIDGPIYEVRERFGSCRGCGRYEDLRYEVCFKCSDKVAGELLGKDADGSEVYRLWLNDAPLNLWHVRVPALAEGER